MGATTNKLTVGGNVVIGGNTSGTSVLTLSSAIGGDIYLSGNWDTKTNGSYNSNSRAVFFQGAGTSTVTTIGAATFDFLFITPFFSIVDCCFCCPYAFLFSFDGLWLY